MINAMMAKHFKMLHIGYILDDIKIATVFDYAYSVETSKVNWHAENWATLGPC